MQAASQHLVNGKLRDMETSLEHKIEKVNKSAIRWRKCEFTDHIVFLSLLPLILPLTPSVVERCTLNGVAVRCGKKLRENLQIPQRL